MENSLKALILAASISITCMVISIGFYAGRQAREISSVTTKKLNELSIHLSEEDFSLYDGLVVRGSDVVNFIYKKLSFYSQDEHGSIYIYVDTGTSQSKYGNNINLSKLKDYTSDSYIHPLGKYKGQVIRNENEVIVGMSFIAE